MNCLAYALRFWRDNKDYRIWYNSDHCINIPIDTYPTFTYGRKFLPAEDFGINYFKTSFEDLLDEEEKEILKEYFNFVSL